jgi:hypothetical protein
MLDLTDLESHCVGADLVIAGEGLENSMAKPPHALKNSSRSALIVSACVVGMPSSRRAATGGYLDQAELVAGVTPPALQTHRLRLLPKV